MHSRRVDAMVNFQNLEKTAEKAKPAKKAAVSHKPRFLHFAFVLEICDVQNVVHCFFLFVFHSDNLFLQLFPNVCP